MRKYLVNVNGTSYEIQVEEIAQGAASAPASAAPPAPAQAAPAAPAAAAGQDVVNAPMPGVILDVKCAAGEQVKAGQVLMVLEAMKMENEIMSPRDGKVIAMNVTKGTSVNSGQTLCIIG